MGVAVDIDAAEGTVAVLASNWPSFDAFIACSTQWRTESVTMGSAAGIMSMIEYIGLDYTACDVVLRARKAEPQVFSDIMAMEAAALPVMNEVD